MGFFCHEISIVSFEYMQFIFNYTAMKKTHIQIGVITAGLLSLSIAPSSAMYVEYNTVNDFLDANELCLQATNWENEFDIKDGTLLWYDKSYEADLWMNWQCALSSGPTNKIMTITQDNIAFDSVTGEVTQIENGKDGKQITITTADGEIYTTAVSVISDTIQYGEYEDIVVGATVIINYTDKSGNLLIGDSIVINNVLFDTIDSGIDLIPTTVLPVVNASYEKKLEATMDKIENNTKNFSSLKKAEFMDKLEALIDSKLTPLYAVENKSQDDVQKIYSLELLKIKLSLN